MPKGKPKAKNPDLYIESPGAELERLLKSTAPQAAPHRRGGTHRVKEGDLTHTHWDLKGYHELVAAAKARRIWRKDMPKRVLAHRLAAIDKENALAVKRANADAYQRRKLFEEKKKIEKQLAMKENEERRKVRVRKAALGEDVSSSSEEEPPDVNIALGHLVSDEEDDYESITTTTTAPSSLSPIAPALKLRIFEWHYPEMPPESPPVSPISLSGRIPDEAPQEPLLRELPYTVMNVVTTKSRETLELPGRNMPEEVGPDFVPKLSEHTKDCARNGVILEQLGNAVIERGVDWAVRTQVQWWNGRMYFHLPPRKTKANLADVYEKWKKKKRNIKTQQTRIKGRGIVKNEPKQRAQARLQERKEKMIDVFAASKHRPPICYVPSYLDFPLLDDDEEVAKSPYNLFYVRFRNMRLPHYFFWADPDEWENPTVPNPAWAETEANRTLQPVRPTIPRNNEEAQKVMVKRKPIPFKFSPSAAPPNGSKYKVALWAIERDLYLHGWAKTMYLLREKWLKQGKGGRWTRLISRLVSAFPGGNLPTSPPVPPTPITASLAEKFAAVDVPSPLRPVEPIYGDEPWTRDDAAYWTPVPASELKGEEGIQTELLRSSSLAGPKKPQALHRRRSEVFAWVDDLGSPITPPAVSTPLSPLPAFRAAEREAWEERFLEQVEGETALATTIESMPIAQLKGRLFNMMNECRRSSLLLSRCAFCLTSLEGLSVQERRAHHEIHAESANELCPFCGMPWVGWSSELRAAHIFYHDVEEGAQHLTRRKSLSVSSGFGALAAIPKTKQKRGTKRGESTPKGGARKLSKVHFSPVTVEKRIAYNDVTNQGEEMMADESSLATTSPKRSNLRSHVKTTEKSRNASVPSPTPKRTTRSTARAKSDDTDVSWDPRRYSASSSEHILSPPLHKRQVRPSGHPDAKWDPRRVRKSSSESLEYKTVSRHPRKTMRKKRNVGEKALERRASESTNREKGIKAASEQVEDFTNDDEPLSISSSEPPSVNNEYDNSQEPTRCDELPSPASSPASSTATLRRKSVAYPEQQSIDPAKPSRPVTHKALSRLTPLNMKKKPHRDSTVSNASSSSDVCRQADVEWPDEDLIKVVTNKKRTSTPSALSKCFTTPPSLTEKKRKATVLEPAAPKTSSAPASIKRQKSSDNSSKELRRSISSGSDYIAFVDDDLLEDHTSDVLTGNPFAAVPKKLNAKTMRNNVNVKNCAFSAGYSPPKKRDPKARKVLSAVKTALETKHNATATDLKTSRASRTTILGRPHVEPLPVAPARRYSQSCSQGTASDAAPTSNFMEDFPDPPTSASTEAISPKQTTSKRSRAASRKPSTSTSDAPPDYSRGRRSFAPTPSPNLTAPSPSFNKTTVRTKGKAMIPKTSPRPIDVVDAKRKASYDVPFSDVRAIVPPNTPADGLAERRRSSKSTTETIGGPSLDARQLSVKIGTVKTTRGGLVRELPVGVEKSVAGKPKARGRSVAMRRKREMGENLRAGRLPVGAVDAEPVVRKRVVKKGVKLTRPASIKNVAAKTQAASRRKSEVDKSVW